MTLLRRFLQNESGAITVDWVVLTGATVGLGLAGMAVVSGGVEDLANDTDSALRGTPIGVSFSNITGLFSTDFSSGASGWFGGTPITLAGFGEVLQIGEGSRAEMQLELPDGTEQATVSFDLIAADDLNNDPATIFINGQAVAVYRDNHGRVSLSDNGVAGISVAAEQHYTNNPVGAGDQGHDSRVTYTITVDDPGPTLTFGVHSGTDDGIADEFYAIDDVDIQSG